MAVAAGGEIRIEAGADAVWAVVGDLRSMVIMDGLVERLEVDGDGEGAVRRLVLPGGAAVTERIEVYDAAGRSYVYRIVDRGPLPFDHYVGKAVVTPDGPAACVLAWDASAEPLGGDAEPVRAAIQANIDHALGAIAAHFRGVPEVWTTSGGPRFTPLDASTCADVAIIGAGYSGLVAALELRRRGVSVVVLEKAAPGAGASGRNAGHFAPMLLGGKATPDTAIKTLGPERGARWNRTVAGAGRWLMDLAATHAIDCDLRPGYLCVTRTATSLDRARQRFAAWDAFGGHFAMVSAADVAHRLGTPHYAGGIWLPEGGTLHPLKLAQGLAQAAQALGAQIHAGTPVQSVERHGTVWRVQTPGGHVDAPHVLVATGVTDGTLFPGISASVYPVGCGLVATPPLPAPPMPDAHAFVDLDDAAIFSPAVDTEGRLVVSTLLESLHPKLPSAAAPALRRLARVFPELRTRFTAQSHGTIGVTPDGLPRIFRLDENVYALGGCNGFGLTLGMAAAREAAARIAGEIDMALPLTAPRRLPGHRLIPWALRTIAAPLANRRP